MMANQMNQDLVNRVHMYLDNELSKEDERQLLSELRQSPKLLETLNKEQAFKEFIKNKVNRKKVSPALIQSIKDKIQVNQAWVSA